MGAAFDWMGVAPFFRALSKRQLDAAAYDRFN
jgi:hypothetical protein